MFILDKIKFQKSQKISKRKFLTKCQRNTKDCLKKKQSQLNSNFHLEDSQKNTFWSVLDGANKSSANNMTTKGISNQGNKGQKNNTHL